MKVIYKSVNSKNGVKKMAFTSYKAERHPEIFLNPTTLRIKKQVAKAASGIITEFVRKSKKSRNAIPKI